MPNCQPPSSATWYGISHSSFSLSDERSIASCKMSSHGERSSDSSFNFYHPLLSWKSFSSCVHLLPRLLFISILSFAFPPITCFRKQFVRQTWPIESASRLLPMNRALFLRDTLPHFFISHTIVPNDILHISLPPHFRNFRVFLLYRVTWNRLTDFKWS